jgi:hypothetical protein
MSPAHEHGRFTVTDGRGQDCTVSEYMSPSSELALAGAVGIQRTLMLLGYDASPADRPGEYRIPRMNLTVFEVN